MTSRPVASYQTARLLVYDDSEALPAVTSPQFQSDWRTLAGKCPWSTSLQSPEFVCTWYECYGEVYRPLVLVRHSAGGEMDGLLALAVERATGKLTFAGAHQAEYNVWLALPGEPTFLLECLERLEQLGFASLTFTYLPPGSPLEWLKGSWSDRSTLRAVQRPLLTVDNIDAVRESIGKKKNRRRLEKLQENGPLTFLELHTPDELDTCYDDIIDFYDLRIGAVHGTCPFRDDPRKRGFYRALMAKGILHVTITKVGETVVASHIGLRNKQEVVLGIVGHSPFQAIHSPGKLHILQLGLLMHEQGFSSLDLTPGGDSYKEDRATRYDEAYELTLFLDPKARGHQDLSKSLARTAARALHLDKEAASRLRSLASNPVQSLHSSVHSLAKRTWSSSEARFYRMQADSVRDMPGDGIRRDCLRDLFCYQPGGTADRSKQEFLKDALSAIEAGVHFYSVVRDNDLMFYSQLVLANDKGFARKLPYDYQYPSQSAAIAELYINPHYRDQGACLDSLRKVIREAGRTMGVEFVYLTVDASDPSRKIAEQAGFLYQDSIIQSVKLGAVQTVLVKR